MIRPSTLCYLDTNFLIHVRHYLNCREVSQDYHPDSAVTGASGVDVLEQCREKVDFIELVTSTLTRFEMNQKYRDWVTKKQYLEFGIPLEAVDGSRQYLYSGIQRLPENTREEWEMKVRESQDWIHNWEYSDLVREEPLIPDVFEVADPFQAWAPKIQLMDALHIAAALVFGAEYFVTSDTKLITALNEYIAPKLKSNDRLPNNSRYYPEIRAVNIRSFKQKLNQFR